MTANSVREQIVPSALGQYVLAITHHYCQILCCDSLEVQLADCGSMGLYFLGQNLTHMYLLCPTLLSIGLERCEIHFVPTADILPETASGSKIVHIHSPQ